MILPKEAVKKKKIDSLQYSFMMKAFPKLFSANIIINGDCDG